MLRKIKLQKLNQGKYFKYDSLVTHLVIIKTVVVGHENLDLTFIHAYELMLGLHVFRQTGPPRRVDCLAPPSVYHIKTEASC